MPLLFGLLLAFFLFLGCTDFNGNTITPPFSAAMFFSKVTDLNYTKFLAGDYNSMFVIVDGNKLSVSPFPDVNGLDINTSWTNITGFPAPCGTNQAVQIIGTTLTCITLYTDSNLPSYVMMDTNDINRLNTSIPTFDLLFSFGNKIVGDGNLYFNSITDTLYNRRLINTFDVNTARICFPDGTCQDTQGLTTSDWNRYNGALFPTVNSDRVLIGKVADDGATQNQVVAPINYIGDVSNPVVTQVAGDSFNANNINWNFFIYAYQDVGTYRVYSKNPLSASFTDDGLGGTYDINLSWDSVPDANGYMLQVYSSTYDGNAIIYYTDFASPTAEFFTNTNNIIFGVQTTITPPALNTPASPFSSGYYVKGDFEIKNAEAIAAPVYASRTIDYSAGTLNTTVAQVLIYAYFHAKDGTPVISNYGGFWSGTVGDLTGNNFQVDINWLPISNAEGYIIGTWLNEPSFNTFHFKDVGNVTNYTVNGDYSTWDLNPQDNPSYYTASPYTRSNLITDSVLSTDRVGYLAQYSTNQQFWMFGALGILGTNSYGNSYLRFSPTEADLYDSTKDIDVWQDISSYSLKFGQQYSNEFSFVIPNNPFNGQQFVAQDDFNIVGRTMIDRTATLVDDGASTLQLKGQEIVVDNVSSGSATQVAGTSFVANGNDWAFNITAYKLVGTQRVYSTTPYAINFLDDSLGGTYDIDLSWGAVTDANGYMIFIGATNNYPDLSGRAMDVPTNSLTFNGLNTIHGTGNGVYLPQSPYTPTTKNFGNIQMVNPETLSNPNLYVSKDYLGGSYNNQSLSVSVFAYKTALDGTTFVSLDRGEANNLPISDFTSTNFEIISDWNAVPDALGYFVDVYDNSTGDEWYVDVGNVLTYTDDGTHAGWTTGILLETYPFSPYTKAKIFSDEFWSSDNRSFLAKYDEYNQVWSFPQNMVVNNVILNPTEDGGQIYAGGNNIWWSNVDDNFYLGGRPSGFFGANPVITIPFNNMEFGEVTIDANVHVDGNLYQKGNQVCDTSGNCPDNDTNYRTWDNNTFTNALVTNDLNVDRDLNVGRNIYIKGNLTLDGNTSMKRPYIMASSTKTQTIANSTLAYTVDFNTTEDNYLMHTEVTATDTNIKVDLSGDYRFDISALAYTTSGSNKHIYIWMQKLSPAGAWVDVPRSNTQVEIPTQQVETVIAVPFIIDLNAGGKIRFKWGSDTTAAQLLYLGAGTNPTRPEVPSIIVVGNKVSEIAH